MTDSLLATLSRSTSFEPLGLIRHPILFTELTLRRQSKMQAASWRETASGFSRTCSESRGSSLGMPVDHAWQALMQRSCKFLQMTKRPNSGSSLRSDSYWRWHRACIESVALVPRLALSQNLRYLRSPSFRSAKILAHAPRFLSAARRFGISSLRRSSLASALKAHVGRLPRAWLPAFELVQRAPRTASAAISQPITRRSGPQLANT